MHTGLMQAHKLNVFLSRFVTVQIFRERRGRGWNYHTGDAEASVSGDDRIQVQEEEEKEVQFLMRCIQTYELGNINKTVFLQNN